LGTQECRLVLQYRSVLFVSRPLAEAIDWRKIDHAERYRRFSWHEVETSLTIVDHIRHQDENLEG